MAVTVASARSPSRSAPAMACGTRSPSGAPVASSASCSDADRSMQIAGPGPVPDRLTDQVVRDDEPRRNAGQLGHQPVGDQPPQTVQRLERR